MDQGELPETFEYIESRSVITVGSGEVGPVSKSVWEYEVSGLKVVQSWLRYRKRNRAGRKSSPLDEITGSGWTSEFTTELLMLLHILEVTVERSAEQDSLLSKIVAGQVLEARDLGPVQDAQRKGPGKSIQDEQLDLTP